MTMWIVLGTVSFIAGVLTAWRLDTQTHPEYEEPWHKYQDRDRVDGGW